MANTNQGNTHYVDSTGTLSTRKNVKLLRLIVTSTSTAASLILQDYDASTPVNMLQVDIAADNTTEHLDFSAAPIIFPNGITAGTVTNCVATLVVRSESS